MSERIYGIKENKSLMDITPSLEASAIVRASAETINFTGLKSNVPVQVEGATEQNKYSGAQIFDHMNIFRRNGVKEEINNNVIKMTVTSQGTARKIQFNIGAADYYDGKTITVSLSNYEKNHDKKSGLLLFWFTANDTWISNVGGVTYPNLSGTFTLTKPENASKLMMHVGVGGDSETCAIGDYTEFIDLMVTEGSTVKPWEPYTGIKPSPNIHYPQDIYAIGDRGNLDVTCTQGSDVHTLSIPLSRPLYSMGGLTEEITKNESGRWGVQRYFDRVIFDGSADEGWTAISTADTNKKRLKTSFIKDSIKIPVNSNSKINMLCDKIINSTGALSWQPAEGISVEGSGSATGDVYIYCDEFNTADVSLWTAFLSENPMELIYELKEPIWEQLPDDVQKVFNNFTSFEGANVISTTDETTVKYRGELNTAGAISDSFTVQDGHFGVMRKVGVKTFNGSDDEYWNTNPITSVDPFVFHIWTQALIELDAKRSANDDVIANISCNRYNAISQNALLTPTKGIAIDTGANLKIYDPAYNTTDRELWKAHLAENPLTVYYELSNPVFEPLEGILKPKLTIDYAQTPYGAEVLNMLAGGGSGGGNMEPDANGNMAIGNYTDFGFGENNLTIGANAHVTPGSFMSVHVGTDSGRYNKGSRNMGLGYGTLMGKIGGANTAHRNVAIGLSAARDADSINNSVYIGAYAGERATGGSNNTYVGVSAGKYNNGEGHNNVGIGANSLTLNTEGLWNVAIGSGSLRSNTTGDNNMAIGGAALADNTTGFGNTAVGTSALSKNTVGQNNVAIGGFALNTCTNVTGNIAIGYQALKANTIQQNVAIGTEACMKQTTAWRTTAIGTNALNENIIGTDNTAIGFQTLKNTTGNNNTAVGASALLGCTTGVQNTAVGMNAGNGVITGINNTALGYKALSVNCNFNHCVGLGSNTQVTGDKQIQLGNSDTTAYAYAALQIRSDGRDKDNIRDTSLGLDFINSLKAREFQWDLREDYREWDEETQSYIEHEKDGTKRRARYHQGFIAQEVKAAMDDLGVDFAGYQDHKVNGGKDVLSLGYEEFIAPLVKAVQELSTEVQQLKAENSRASNLLSKWTSKLKDKG